MNQKFDVIATKKWKIGEYAIGGIIEATVLEGNRVVLRALKWSDEGEVKKCEFEGKQGLKIDHCLNEFTTYYFAQQIMTWLRHNAHITNHH